MAWRRPRRAASPSARRATGPPVGLRPTPDPGRRPRRPRRAQHPQPRRRAAARAGDQQRVARAAPRTATPARARPPATVPSTVTATTSSPAAETSPTHHRAPAGRRGLGHAGHHPERQPRHLPSRPGGRARPAPPAARTHGRQVADRAHQRLPAHVTGGADGEVDVHARHHAVDRHDDPPAAGDLDHRGVVAQSERLDSVSQHASDTLQDLVFLGERCHVPRFGGSHGTCLALDPAETGRTKEQIPPKWRPPRTRNSWPGSTRWPR